MVLIMMEPSLFLGKIFSLTGEKFFSLRGESSCLPPGFFLRSGNFSFLPVKSPYIPSAPERNVLRMWGRCPVLSVPYNIYKEMHLIRGRKVGKMNIQAIFFLENILRFGKLSYLCIRFPEIKRREASKKRSLKDLR